MLRVCLRLSPRASVLALFVASTLAAPYGCIPGPAEFDDCYDGVDNDGDGLIDTLDPGCQLNDNAYESPDPEVFLCSDGLDNDGDELTDFPADPGCENSQDNTEDNEVAAQCFDGIDNDEDGLIDYPRDPGCFSRFANDETDDCPNGPQCPACSNRMDDDDDGVFDYPADPGCDTAVDDNEFNANVNNCGPEVTIIDLMPNTTVSGTAEADGPHYLASPECGGLGQETVYRIDFPQPSYIVATTELPQTDMDTVLYIRSVCRDIDTEIACNDDGQTTLGSTIATPVDAGTYFIIVDAHHPTTAGNFALRVDVYAGPGTMCDPLDPNACPPGHDCRPLDDSTTDTTCELPECMDEIDNDFDGYIDYPFDPGCPEEIAGDETDDCPAGPGCPQCGNETDDDGDGFIDFGDDTGCSSAADISEIACPGESDTIELLTAGTTLGTTVGFTDDFSGTCDFSSGVAPDRVYALNVPGQLLSLSIDTFGSAFDTILYVKQPACDGPEVACNDDNGGTHSAVDISNAAPGTWLIIIDGRFFESGATQLNVHGVIPGGDACDAATVASGLFSCEPGYGCSGGMCVESACNNGMDDDSDGDIDYPEDPGCADISGTDETDDCPTGPNCPQCSNMMDDDGDGVSDYGSDPGCIAASDDDEQDCNEETDTLQYVTTASSTGTTTGATNDFEPSCFIGNNSVDVTHVIQLETAVDELTIAANLLSFDTVLSVKTPTCSDPDFACTFGFAAPATVTIPNPAVGTYFAIVEGYFGGFGDYTFDVEAVLPTGAACTGLPDFYVCGPNDSCNGGICTASLCTNGTDDDGDGLVDFGQDPGCDSEGDNDEFDDCPGGATCPACANQMDDDGDGAADYPADTGCTGVWDTNELNCEDSEGLFTVEMTSTFTGNTSAATDDHQPLTCGFAGGAPDHVYWLDIPVALSSLRASTAGSTFDTILYAREPTCSTIDLACDDDGAGGVQSLLNLGPLAPGDLFIIVDGYDNFSGSYTLEVTGEIAAGEACDSDLVTDGVLTCVTGTTCMDNGMGLLQCL